MTPLTDKAWRRSRPASNEESFETLGLRRHDPEIGSRVIDHCRDHALETQEDTKLNGYEHDREDNPHHGGDQSNPVMKKIARGKRKNQAHRPIGSLRNGMARYDPSKYEITSSPRSNYRYLAGPVLPARSLQIIA